jgi:hypothetical protein
MVREGKHSGIDDDTRTRARRFAEDAGMPKPALADLTKRIAKNQPAVTAKSNLPKQRIVSKKELEDSGLSLRDFLNRERGLTRRGMSVADAKKQLNLGEQPSAKSVADAKSQLGMSDSERAPRRSPEPVRMPRRTPEPLSSTRKPGTNINYENSNVSDMTFKRGGMTASKRADGCAIRGKTRA